MKNALIGIACAVVTTAAYAQERSIAGGDVTKSAVVVDTTTDIDPDFSDPGDHTVTGVASLLGVSVAEARSRLQTQQRSALLIQRLSTEFPDTFTGLRFSQGPTLRITALFKRGGATEGAITSAARDAGITHPVELGIAAMSRADENLVGSRLLAELRRIGRTNIDFMIDPEAGTITLGAPPDDVLRALVSAVSGGLITETRFSPDIEVVPSTFSIAGQFWNAQSGNYPLCTTGFSIQNTTTVTRGATTAGHCDLNSPAEFNIYNNTAYGDGGGNRLVFQTQWISGGLDIQWHTMGETDDGTESYYWNGNNSTVITSTFKLEPQAGQTLCKFGRTTLWDCGTTGGRVWDGDYGGYFYTIDHPSVSMSEGGDSGGPVVAGQQAWGWTHGRQTGGVNVFLSIERVYAGTPLRLTICPTC